MEDSNNRDPAAIIVGGHFPSLGAARNLARHGVAVYLVDEGICVTQFSRHIKRYFRCPAIENEEEFVPYLQALAAKEHLEGSVVFPSTDESVRILSLHRQALSTHLRITTPEWGVIKYLYDKRLTYLLAQWQAVPIPATWNPVDLQELVRLDLEFPVVVKPAITTHLTSVTKKKGYRAENRSELVTLYEMLSGFMDPAEILIQELIPGRADNLYSYFGYFKDGEPVSSYCAKRSRQHPMEFGRASTFANTVNLPELETLGNRLLSGVGYTGLAEAEFMYDPKHRRFELLEVNPRIWGWISLAFHAGVDLAYLAYAQTIGRECCTGPFHSGAKWMCLTTDIPTAAAEIWHRNLLLRDYLRSVRSSQDAVLSISDPLPFLAELLLIPYYAKHRGL